MKVIIKKVTEKTYDYIIDSLSGNYGWEPLSSIEPEIIARFIHKDTAMVSSDPVLYDVVLTDACGLKSQSDHISIHYRENLAILDSYEFEKVEII
jgi:hypothetical protein